jgi:thiamine biosynthesis lipoprotein
MVLSILPWGHLSISGALAGPAGLIHCLKRQRLPSNRSALVTTRSEVRQSPAALRKTHPDVRIDLSAIAKGYGVDVIATYLHAQGTSGFMVEIGGEVRTYGSNFSKAWRIGITSPRANGRVDTVVELGNRAVATSGDYHNYIEINGKRYSHTIDPLSGRPVQHQLAAATVLDSACVWADAWATAINVLGPQAGLALAEKRKLPVLLYVREKKRFTQTGQFWLARWRNGERKKVDAANHYFSFGLYCRDRNHGCGPALQ